MDVAPLRIECIDISHVQGTDVVASLVVFEDGLAKRSDYRRFAIRDRPGDDVASIAEVVRRRFTHSARPAAEEPTDPAPDPAGGDSARHRPDHRPRPPLRLPPAAAGRRRRRAAGERRGDGVAELGIVDVTVCGLAKRLEEVWLPVQQDPVIFPRTSEALYLLQRLRDEAHRFAITYHRAKRSKSMTVSALDSVPGLGEVRRKALVRHFGSVAALRRADVEQILEVPGVGRRTAEAVVAALAGSRSPGTDTVTVSGP